MNAAASVPSAAMTKLVVVGTLSSDVMICFHLLIPYPGCPIGSTCSTGTDFCTGIVSGGSSIGGVSSTGGGSRGPSAGLSTWQAAGLAAIAGAPLFGAAF